MTELFKLVVVSAGTSDPSSTRLLADRAAQRVASLAASAPRQAHEAPFFLNSSAAESCDARPRTPAGTAFRLSVDAEEKVGLLP